MAEYIVDTTDGIYNARMTGELVRCGECMHMEPRTFHDPIIDTDFGWFRCDYFNRSTRRDGFCAWGSRK